MKYKTRLLLTGLAGGLISLCLLGISVKNQNPVRILERPESGIGSREVPLQVELQGKKYPVRITLREIPYKEEEVNDRLREAADGLEAVFLGVNGDMNHIMSDVFMPTVYPGTEISIQWYLDSWKYIEADGMVKNEMLREDFHGKVQAVLTLADGSMTWEREYTICPPEAPDTEQMLRMLQYQIQETQEEPDREVHLPETLQGEVVAWYSPADYRWLWSGALTILALCVLLAGRRSEEEEAQKRRERNLQLAYPDIVSRLSLYMGAGISTRKAWERIVENYEQKNGEKQKSGDAYEEMRTALHEMQNGVPEVLAYERFGTRCRLPSYLKLGTLLSQNLRKGTKNLAGLLEEESREAFEERKAYARKLGEECESKLLLPMMLMLLTILVMIMYPAVVSFQM